MSENKAIEIELDQNTPPAMLRCEGCGGSAWELIVLSTEDKKLKLLIRCHSEFCQMEHVNKLGIDPAEVAWQIFDITGQIDMSEVREENNIEVTLEDEDSSKYLN